MLALSGESVTVETFVVGGQLLQVAKCRLEKLSQIQRASAANLPIMKIIQQEAPDSIGLEML